MFQPQRKLKIYVVSNLTDWYFFVHEDRLLIAGNFGPLPSGYKFNSDTATLHSLAQAHRWLVSNMGEENRAWRVVTLCTTERGQQSQRKRRAAA